MLGKSAGDLGMSGIALASSLVRQIGGERGTAKRCIQNAYGKLRHSFTYSRVRDFFNADERCAVGYDEIVELQRVAGTMREIEATGEEARTFLSRLERIEAALRLSDPDFAESFNLASCMARSGVDQSVDRGDRE